MAVLDAVGTSEYDQNDIFLEVECGAGGEESMMFASEILDMYVNYAAYKGWEASLVSIDRSETNSLYLLYYNTSF